MGEYELQTESPVRKLAGSVVVAVILGILAAGFSTWRLADKNRDSIVRLEEFATLGERCTARDCRRLEDGTAALSRSITSHDHEPAHREAAIRLQTLESWRKIHDLHPHQ